MSNGSIEKGLSLLTLIGDRPGMTLTQVMQATGLPKATCHRFLAALCEVGLLRKSATDATYRLGFRLIRLGAQAEAQLDLVELAKPHLVHLQERFGETAHVAVLEGHSVFNAGMVESSNILRPWTVIGERVPINGGATAKCIAAFMTDKQLEAALSDGPLLRYTNRTTVDLGEFKAQLAKVRVEGYYLSSGERYEGVTSLAAPILDRGGVPAGALAFRAPSSRMSPEVVEAMIPELKAASLALSGELGAEVTVGSAS